jgi:ATP synthase protein I
MGADREQPTSWSGMGTGWAITSTLVGGLAAWGGIGYIVDRLAHTQPVFTAIGFMVGAVGGIYLVWLQHGKDTGDTRTR